MHFTCPFLQQLIHRHQQQKRYTASSKLRVQTGFVIAVGIDQRIASGQLRSAFVMIHYNDIQPWDYKALPAAFGAPPDRVRTYRVTSKQQVEELFADAEFASADRLRFVELVMPWDDAPAALKMTAQATAKRNAEA